jgi:hypothetical protein
VHHPVTRPGYANATVQGGSHVLKHPGHCLPVAAVGKPFAHCWLRERLKPQNRLRRAEPLAHSGHQALTSARPDEREFD